MIFSRCKSELCYQLARNGLSRVEGHSRLGSLEACGRNIVRKSGDSTFAHVEATLLAERCIARDGRRSAPETGHVVCDYLFCIRKSFGELSAKLYQQRPKCFGCRCDVSLSVRSNMPSASGSHGRSHCTNRQTNHLPMPETPASREPCRTVH